MSVTGDFSPWVTFVCEAVTAQAHEAMRQVGALVEIRERYVRRLREVRAKGVSLQIAEDLVGHPMLTVNSAAAHYGVSFQAANLAVGKLVGLGMLRQRSSGAYARIFECPEVLAVMEEVG